MAKNLRKRKTYSFDAESLTPEVLELLEHKGDVESRSDFIKKAVTFYHEHLTHGRGQRIRLIQENYEEYKYLVRKIGNANAEVAKKEKEFSERNIIKNETPEKLPTLREHKI